MNVSFPPFSIGSVIALVVLVLAVVFIVLGRLPLDVGVLVALLAVARLS